MKFLGSYYSEGGFAPLRASEWASTAPSDASPKVRIARAKPALERQSFAHVFRAVGAMVIVLQLGGGTPLGKSFEQLQRSVTRPVPQAPPAAVSPPDSVWVPDRYLPDPVHGRVLVPGHWERRLSDGESYVPPLTICGLATGECTTVPAGVRQPSP